MGTLEINVSQESHILRPFVVHDMMLAIYLKAEFPEFIARRRVSNSTLAKQKKGDIQCIVGIMQLSHQKDKDVFV